MAADSQRPLLVGESNPYGARPEHALYPAPAGCAGERLCRVVLGMEPAAYLRAFDRANLLAGQRWSAPQAREAAAKMMSATRVRLYILLGQRVAAAFGAQDGLVLWPAFSWRDSLGDRFVLLPHPSGRCRVWDEPGAVAQARTVLRIALPAPIAAQIGAVEALQAKETGP